MTHNKTYAILFFIIQYLWITEAVLKCDIIKNGDPGDYNLSPGTIEATRRNNSEIYQVKFVHLIINLWFKMPGVPVHMSYRWQIDQPIQIETIM